MFKYFIYGFLAVIPLSFFADYAYSAETRPYMYRVQQTAQLQDLLSRGSVPVIYETVATTPAGQQVTRYTTRNTVMNATRLGTIARSAVGGPAILAATAAFVAYDYFFDEDTQTWTTQPSVLDDDVAPDGYAFCALQSGSYISCSSTRYGLLQKERVRYGYPDNPNCVLITSTSDNGGYGSMTIRGTSPTNTCVGGVIGARIYRPTAPVGFIPDGPYIENGEPVSDSDLGDAIADASPDSVTDILNDPITSGTWPDRWPEMVPTVQEIEDQLGHDIEGAPIPVNPDQTITDGSTVAPPEVDTGSGGSMSSEWPTFCGWATPVCDFIDWVKEEPDEPEVPDLPFIDVEVETDLYDSGLPSDGLCPEPEVYQFLTGEFEIPYDMFCQFAASARPFVLGSAYLAAIYLMLFGVRRG